MERDQERFYEDEIRETAGDVMDPKPEEDVNDMKFFLELLVHLRTAVESGRSIPLSGKKVVDGVQLLEMIDDMENNLPDAVQYGRMMYAEKQRIMSEAESQAMSQVSSAEMRANAALEKARSEAEKILLDAENEARDILNEAQENADRMVDESEIIRRATEEARIIVSDARVEVSELRLKVQHEVHEMLAGAEEALNNAGKIVRRRRSELGEDV